MRLAVIAVLALSAAGACRRTATVQSAPACPNDKRYVIVQNDAGSPVDVYVSVGPQARLLTTAPIGRSEITIPTDMRPRAFYAKSPGETVLTGAADNPGITSRVTFQMGCRV
ncbi:MAG TPA: hypothetical protein VFO55_00775 [Gemmatimonadaceae bacterium]|nr:hypothetical protein [Gemmatimonadaceae bacterium]